MPPPTLPPSSAVHDPSAEPNAPGRILDLKPPLPTWNPRVSGTNRNDPTLILPPLIAGALLAGFAEALADNLGNDLLTHYYLPEQKVRVNVDRVVDRLLGEFSLHLWDELWDFYCEAEPGASRQIVRLFEGPLGQLALILNGSETSRCILDRLGPGLSRRPAPWSTGAHNIGLPMALRLMCSFWDREVPARATGGSPEQIARTLHNRIVTGVSSARLVGRIREVLVSPHYVQMHIMESAVWDMLLKRPYRVPADGFYVVQFSLECRLFGPQDGIGDPGLVQLGSLPAITGTANDCIYTTVAEYTNMQWPKCGAFLLNCLEEAVTQASESARQGHGFSGMSIWDGSNSGNISCPGLGLLHLEVEEGCIRLSVSAWMLTMIDVLRQMAWTCAALSASPFPDAVSESALEVTDWTYLDDSVYVTCGLSQRPITEGDGSPELRALRNAAIATGFPIQHANNARAL